MSNRTPQDNTATQHPPARKAHNAHRPNFFIVGAPKCGTTSMHSYLTQHPDIFMSRYKEPYFFADGPVRLRISDEARYLRLFRQAGTATVVGESSVGYLYSRATAERIHRYSPDARILIMVRHPMDLARSLHAQMLKTGDEDIVPFESAYRASIERRHNRRVPVGCAVPLMLDYAGRARYVDGIRTYLEVFGPSRVHVVVLDDLVAAPAETLARVFAFLGVRRDVPLSLEPQNVRPDRLPNITARRFLKRYPAVHRVLHRVIPDPMWNRIKAASSWIQRQPHRAPAFRDPGLIAEIEGLEALLGRDLAHWKARA
jgi:hypothetical protein